MDAPSTSGFLILASPALRDPNFRRSVVLMVDHELEGSLGFVLNRPLGRTLGDVLDGLAPPAAAIPLFDGGPVQTDRVQLLGPGAGPREVLPGLGLGGSLSTLEALDGAAGPFRAFVGYAGWGGGQLHDEIAEGAWIVAPARPDHVLAVPPEQLWRRVLRELGGSYAWMALEEGSAGEN